MDIFFFYTNNSHLHLTSCLLSHSRQTRESNKKYGGEAPNKAKEYSRKTLQWGIGAIVAWCGLLILTPLLLGLLSYLLTFINWSAVHQKRQMEKPKKCTTHWRHGPPNKQTRQIGIQSCPAETQRPQKTFKCRPENAETKRPNWNMESKKTSRQTRGVKATNPTRTASKRIPPPSPPPRLVRLTGNWNQTW